MKIALVQKNLLVGGFDHNVKKLLDGLCRAHALGADLAVTSELSTCGYPPHDLVEQDHFVQQGLGALAELVAKAPLPCVLGYIEPGDGPNRRYNTAALIADGKVIATRRKSLLPTYDVFDERRHFVPAPPEELAPIALGTTRIGLSVCEDMWNDPDFWPKPRYEIDPVAKTAHQGVDLLINISASPFTLGKRDFRPRMLAAQAKKHHVPLVFVNQVGGNDDLVFDGHSLAFDAAGNVIARAHEFAEDVVVADLSAPADVNHLRPLDTPDAALLSALVLGTRDYAHKCGFRSGVVGLSGGIDSAVVCAIAARALGPKNVLGVAMPSRYSSEHSQTDAAELARHLGIDFVRLPIEEAFATFLATLTPAFAARADATRAAGATEENLQARCRGVVLMALSNQLGHLLLTTGNKSELAVGYCTLYGDMAGGLAVIGDIPKTTVYRLAHEINRDQPVIPRSTLTKAPSAELRPNQTDQDSLPPYQVLDPILELYVEQQVSVAEIVARGFDAQVVADVARRVRLSEYKRRQMPPGLIVTTKAFGPGRKMPIARGE